MSNTKLLIQLLTVCLCSFFSSIDAQNYLLIPDRVFDGVSMHEDWVVWVEGNVIKAAGPLNKLNPPKSLSQITLK